MQRFAVFFFLAACLGGALALPDDSRYAEAPNTRHNAEEGGLSYFYYYVDKPDFPESRPIENLIQFGFAMGKRDANATWRGVINPAFKHIGIAKQFEGSEPQIDRCIRLFLNEPTGWEWTPDWQFYGPWGWRKGCLHFRCKKCFYTWEQKGQTLRYIDVYRPAFEMTGSGWIPDWILYTAPTAVQDTPPAARTEL
jgi:hypothetical protein